MCMYDHVCVCAQQALLCFTQSTSISVIHVTAGNENGALSSQTSGKLSAKHRRGSATCLTRSSHPLSPGSTGRGGSKGGLCGTDLFCHSPALLYHCVFVWLNMAKYLNYDSLWFMILYVIIIYGDIWWYYTLLMIVTLWHRYTDI